MNNTLQNIQISGAGVPLVRLRLANPFLADLARRRVNCDALLEEVGFPADRPFSADLFVPITSMYEFTELAADAAGDPHFGAIVGYHVNFESMPHFAAAAEVADSIGELLSRMIINAEIHTNAVKMRLQVDGSRTAFQFKRKQKPDRPPGQIDAYYVGMLVNLFSHSMSGTWNAKRLLAKVVDPQAIPPDFGPLTVLQGDNCGPSIRFPTEWLFEPFDRPHYLRRAAEVREYETPPTTLIDGVRQSLIPHIHEPELNVERGAQLCGFEKRQLARKLRSKGTTLARLIASLREEHAKRELAETNRRIGDIALSVGFKDPAVFSRAFKNWTGQSPKEYRSDNKQISQTG
jgi:AraC-like DNA-binding protein